MEDKLMNGSAELQWCADDFHPSNCDDDEHFQSTISFSNHSGVIQHSMKQHQSHSPLTTNETESRSSRSVGIATIPPPAGYINNQNFDINLAEVDIDTFRSEDLIQRMIRSQNLQLDTSTDTLRIVESLRSLNDHSLIESPPSRTINTNINNTTLQCPTTTTTMNTISVDSLDLSMDGEINSRLIEKCVSHQDKTRYRIALFDTSTHSALDGSIDFGTQTSKNPFEAVTQMTAAAAANGNGGPTAPTTPGSLVKMFMQNRASNENSYYSSSSTDAPQHLPHQVQNGGFHSHQSMSRQQSEPQSCASPSVATVDSGDLPLHVLDISKKLKSMNLKGIPIATSASMSSNTSFTSTTSSSTFDNNNHHRMRRQYSCGSSTNPFVMEESRASTRSTSTQFPEMFQEKGIQASPDDSPTTTTTANDVAHTPVLVYYPNYSLPDLSFLDDILKDKQKPVYLSPVKHEPPKFYSPSDVGPSPLGSTTASATTTNGNSRSQSNGVQKRINRKSNISGVGSFQRNAEKKCRPKSYTDYEILLNQEFNPIQDWDSLNLLLPDDFKEFLEQNDLLPNPSDRRASAGPVNYPIMHQQVSAPQVRMRQNVNRGARGSQRYSLQEKMIWNGVVIDEETDFHGPQHGMHYYPHQHQHPDGSGGQFNFHGNSSMVRSQTMPNCVPPPLQAPQAMCYAPQGCGGAHHPPMVYGHCGQPHSHYSYAHGGQQQQQQQQPQQLPSMPSSMQWDMMSSTSFKKLINFLSKLDDSSTTEHSSASTQATLKQPHTPQHEPAPSNGLRRTASTTQQRRNVVQSSRNNIATRTKAVNDHQSTTTSTTGAAPPPRIPPRNTNLRSSTVAGQKAPELPKRTSSSTTATPHSSTRVVLKRPSTLKSGIPLPSARPTTLATTNIPKSTTASAAATATKNHQQQPLNNTHQHHHRPAATHSTLQQNRQNRTFRSPF